MSAVDYDWWLCRTSDMSQITQLDAHGCSYTPQLNSSGKASLWVHLLDPNADLVQDHTTALRVDRNGKTIWSGAIWQANESSQASSGSQEGQDRLDITAFGWFYGLGRRILHTGAEFQAMLAAPNGLAWQAAYGAYSPLGIDTATQMAYSVAHDARTTDAAIIFDLIDRANIDAPTLIKPGRVYGTAQQRNLTLQRFQKVGDQITNLCNVESGVDFVVDPVTRVMDLYGRGASPSPLIANGLGVDCGRECLFSYPGNCTAASRSRDGTQTENRLEVIGQYGVGRADDLASQAALGALFEDQTSLSEVVDPNILIAYAQAEMAIKSYPWTTISLTPRPVIAGDADAPGVPRPFDDFDVGDIVYGRVDRGSFQVGTPESPQAMRLFGFTVSVGDDGVERLSSIMTTYQGAGTQ